MKLGIYTLNEEEILDFKMFIRFLKETNLPFTNDSFRLISIDNRYSVMGSFIEFYDFKGKDINKKESLFLQGKMYGFLSSLFASEGIFLPNWIIHIEQENNYQLKYNARSFYSAGIYLEEKYFKESSIKNFFNKLKLKRNFKKYK